MKKLSKTKNVLWYELRNQLEDELSDKLYIDLWELWHELWELRIKLLDISNKHI